LQEVAMKFIFLKSIMALFPLFKIC